MFVCIENNQVISILPYQPNVPSSVHVIEISRQDYLDLINNKKTFDVKTGAVIDYSIEVLEQVAKNEEIKQNKNYLDSTDWMVLRHIRQKALGVPTSLTEAEYLALEQKRADAAARIR